MKFILSIGNICMLLLLVVLFMGISLPSVTAQESNIQTLGTFQKNTVIDLIQLCSNCTTNNITSVYYNGSIIVGFSPMTKDGFEFNYTCLNCSERTGEYIVNGVGDLQGIPVVWSYNYFITNTGTELTTGESLVYIILLMSVFILFAISTFFIFIIPYENKTDPEGHVLAVTRTKYIKLGLILISHVLLVYFFNLIIGLSNNFLALSIFSGLFETIFFILNALAFPLFVFIFVWFLFELFRDAKLNKIIEDFGKAMK